MHLHTIIIEPKLNENKSQSKGLISQPPKLILTPQHVFNTIIQQINEAKEKQCLNFTLSIDNANLVLELVDANANLKRLGKLLVPFSDVWITFTNISFVSHITFNSVTKNLHVLIMPSEIHATYLSWFVKSIFLSGQLNAAEKHELRLEVGTSEYSCIPFNFLTYTT